MAFMENGNFEYSDDERVPKKHIICEGESYIKSLSQKQLNTSITTTEKKDFINSSEIFPLSNFLAGQLSIKNFKEKQKLLSRIEFFKKNNLTLQEIKYIMHFENNPEGFFKLNGKIEKNVLNTRLKGIYEKLRQFNKEANTSNTSQPNSISRHVRDLGLAVKPESKETQLYKFAIGCINPPTSKSLSPLEKPINHLEHLEKDLLFNSTKRSRHKIRRLEKKSLENNNDPINKMFNISDYITNHSNVSLWDVQSSNTLINKKEEDNMETSLDLNSTTKIMNNNGNQTSEQHSTIFSTYCTKCKIDLKLKNFKKLSIKEIKNLERFKDYSPGNPNNVLYLKNLSKKLTEEDLYNIYGQFNIPGKNSITCKLMSGKMNCQAFITFPDILIASKALNATLGLIFKGKPIIVYFSNTSRY